MHHRVSIGLVLLAFLPLPAAALSLPQGHQVTPQITEHVVAATASGSGNFGNTYVPSVALVGGVYTVAFRAVKNSAAPALYYWDTTLTSPQVIMTEGTSSITGLNDGTVSSFSGTIATIDATAPPAISASGILAHKVTINSTTPPHTGLRGIAKAPLSTAVAVNVCNELQPVNGTTFKLVNPTAPFSISPSGIVGFHSIFNNPTQSWSSVSGLFAQAASGIDKRVSYGDTPNGVSGTGTLTFLSVGGGLPASRDQQWNSSSTAAFTGTTNGTVGAAGVWTTGPTGGNTAIALSNNVAVGNSPSTWTTFDWPSVNDSGDVAFYAKYGASSTGGIWKTIGGVVTLVASTNNLDNAPDEDGNSISGETFLSFAGPVINSQGDVAFWATTVNGLNSWQGIYIADGTGTLGIRKIAKSGETVRGTSSTYFSFTQDIGIVSSGQVAFVAQLTATPNPLDALFVESETHTCLLLQQEGNNFPPLGQTISSIGFYPGLDSQGVAGFTRGSYSSVALAYRLGFGSNSAIVLTLVD